MKPRIKKLGTIRDLFNENLPYMIMVLILLLSLAGFIQQNFRNLPLQIPLFYALGWGTQQLGPRNYLWIFYGILVFIGIINSVMAMIETRKGNYQISKLYHYFSYFIIVTGSIFINNTISAVTLFDMEVPMIIRIIVLPMVAAAITVLFVTPIVIKLARRNGFMDDPLAHKHPGMLIKKPTPRAGGLAYYLGIIIPGLIILPILSSQKLIGILIGAAVCVLVGLKDDKKDIHPITRLIVQILTVSIPVLSGIILLYIPNPFGDAVVLDQYRITFNYLGEHSVYYYSVLVAMLWMGVTMNFMSFANGSDGAYAGLVFVASFVIAIVMFQTLDVDPEQAMFIKLAALSAGAAIGMAYFTWPPQKILWGFGATSAGLIIAALSIIGSTKVAVMLLVLLIPFFDGLVAVVRRIRRGQLPFWGDREHLHHKLLFRLGWNKSKVATFYWASSIMLGVVGILTSGRIRALWALTMVGIFFLGIAALNFIGRDKEPAVK